MENLLHIFVVTACHMMEVGYHIPTSANFGNTSLHCLLLCTVIPIKGQKHVQATPSNPFDLACFANL